MPSIAEVGEQLTGPGGLFEVVLEDLDGMSMKMYRQRMTSMREIPEQAAQRGDSTYLVHGDRRISFSDFVAGANSVSSQLAACGVRPGDRVAVLSANNPEWVFTFWGTVNLGAILVGLNGWWKTDEIIYGLVDSGARVLVADRGRFERVADRLDQAPTVERVYLIDASPADFGDDRRLHRFDELLTKPSSDLPDTPIAEGDPAVIFYTSGTTGKPKGAISTHRSMIANLQNTMYNAVAGALVAGAPLGAEMRRQTASLMSSPLFHVSGCHSGIVVGLATGAKTVMLDGRFEAEQAMQLIQDERITVWGTVPTMVWRVVEHSERHAYDLSSVTTVAYGGSPSAGELQRRVRETFPNVRTMGNVYGLTESSSAATIISGQEFTDRPDSVGRPLPVVELRIIDPAGTTLPSGQVGEVCIKGPLIMPGYWGKPDATAETVVDGWLHTGDIGYVDADGYLYITDRAKDMIIRGGENVYCVEIENRLAEHPAVAEAAVIGVPHPTLGEEVKAVVRLEDGAGPVAAGELQAWVAAALANVKVPAHVEFTTSLLPRNPAGKVLKNVLRGEGEVTFAETL